MSAQIHQDLNLPEGASIAEIKAAFRQMAKAYHPDTAGSSPENVANFIKAQSAYQKLLKKAKAHNQRQRVAKGETPTDPKPAQNHNWRFLSRREVGLDVHCQLAILRSSAAQSGRVILPWQAQEACPRCLGQGRTLHQVGSLYRPTTCSKCGGTGSVTRHSHLEVNLTPEMMSSRKIRLRKAGLYHPQTAQRGDLILDIEWTNQFPPQN